MSLQDDLDAVTRSASALKVAKSPVEEAIEEGSIAIAKALLPSNLKPADRKRMEGMGGFGLRVAIQRLIRSKLGSDLRVLAADLEGLPEQMAMLDD